MKNRLLVAALSFPFLAFGQWTRLNNVPAGEKLNAAVAEIQSTVIYRLDVAQFRSSLREITDQPQQTTVIKVPNINGDLEEFRVFERSSMSPDLQVKYPDIRSFVGTSLADPATYARFSMSPQGFSGTVLRAGKSEFIEPLTADGRNYIVFNEKMKKSPLKNTSAAAQVKKKKRCLFRKKTLNN